MKKTLDTIANEITPKQLEQRWAGVIKVGTLAVWRSRRQHLAFNKRGGKVTYSLSVIEEYERNNNIIV